MFWNKRIKSEEYLELFKEISHLKIQLEALKLDVELYKRKLKAKKGLIEEKDEDNDKYKNPVLLPE